MKRKRWRVKTKLERRCFYCPECTANHVIVDEDGLHVSCGGDTVPGRCTCSKRLKRMREGVLARRKAQVAP